MTNEFHPTREIQVLVDATKQSPPGLFIEIGTREGDSAKYIFENMPDDSTLICVDPYGNIPYKANDDGTVTLDYNNDMRARARAKLGFLPRTNPKKDLQLLVMEDSEYIRRFADGYPIYDWNKKIVNEYSMVFFDGPHDTQSVLAETEFFLSRTRPGAWFVYDDVDGSSYKHYEVVDSLIMKHGFVKVEHKGNRVSYYRDSLGGWN